MENMTQSPNWDLPTSLAELIEYNEDCLLSEKPDRMAILLSDPNDPGKLVILEYGDDGWQNRPGSREWVCDMPILDLQEGINAVLERHTFDNEKG